MDVEKRFNTNFCEEAFEDNVDETIVNTKDASKSVNEKVEVEIRVDADKTFNNDFCEEAFEDSVDENIVNTTGASKCGIETI